VTRALQLQPLTAEAFRAFGDVIDAAAPCEKMVINEGHTTRHHALAQIDRGPAPGEAVISLFRARPVEAGFALRSMERHPLGSQAFINTGDNPYAVVVAPPGDFDEQAIRGFIARSDQGVNYHRGTWHHYLLALGAPSEFVVIDRVGPGANCDEQMLAEPLTLVLPG
jgi:ureidoglycolate lyase